MGLVIVYVSIGNSDDKLTQAEWAQFVADVTAIIVDGLASHTHGAWFSAPAQPWQNACWCLEFSSEAAEASARHEARDLARKYRQDSIAWAYARTVFLPPAVPVHLLTELFTVPCRHASVGDPCSAVTSEVTCGACKQTPAWQEACAVYDAVTGDAL